MQLIITRPKAQALVAVHELRGLGINAVALPLLGIEPLASAAAGERGAEGGAKSGAEGGAEGDAEGEAQAALHACWARLSECRLVMFVSANAVAHFFAAAPRGAAWPTQTLAGSTGPGTTAALRAAGVPAVCVREPAAGAARLDSEALWQVLRALDWHATRALIVRGERGRDWLAETLRTAGAQVDLVAAYRRTLPMLGADETTLLAAAETQPAQFAWHFSSSEAVRHLPLLAPGGTWRASRAYATHERIAQAVREIGFADVHLLAPGTRALVQAWFAALQSVGPSVGRSAGPSVGPLTRE